MHTLFALEAIECLPKGQQQKNLGVNYSNYVIKDSGKQSPYSHLRYCLENICKFSGIWNRATESQLQKVDFCSVEQKDHLHVHGPDPAFLQRCLNHGTNCEKGDQEAKGLDLHVRSHDTFTFHIPVSKMLRGLWIIPETAMVWNWEQPRHCRYRNANVMCREKHNKWHSRILLSQREETRT